MFRKIPPVVVPVLLAAASFVLHMATASHYGIFRDEFYYIACAKHLAWGYVDHPPLSIALLAGSLGVFGDSAAALRLIPALAGAALIVAVWIFAGELGGGTAARTLAAVSAFFCPQMLGTTSIYSMNALDYGFWAAGFWILIRILRTDDRRLWLALGAVAGLGLLNKISMLFFLFGMGGALLLTPARKHLRSGWFWAGAAVAAVLFLPHVLWQAAHGWPTLEFMSNARQHKMAHLSPLQFLLGAWTDNNPMNALVWVPGLVFLLVSKKAAAFRLLGWQFLAVLVFLAVDDGKPYYLAPAFTVLFAAGGVALEAWLSGRRRGFRLVPALAVSAAGVLSLPFCLRLLPPEAFVAYQKASGVKTVESEVHGRSELPQFWADHFGWENMAKTVADVYATLTPDQKKDCVVFGRNYGEAAAIDYFRKKYDLPPAVSEHNNYYLWGPGRFKGGAIIFIGVPPEELTAEFRIVERRAVIDSKWAMPYETGLPVVVCFGLKPESGAEWGPPRYI
jgi:hypothetical protein